MLTPSETWLGDVQYGDGRAWESIGGGEGD